MALPRNRSIREIVDNATEPLTSRARAIKNSVTTKDGIRGIAFKATGNDPTAAVMAGLALGVAGFGIGLGVKGSKAIFTSIKSVLSKPRIDSKKDETTEHDGIGEHNESLAEITKLLNEGFDKQRDSSEIANNRLSELVKANQELVFITESTLAKTKLEKLERARDKMRQLEFLRETAISQEQQTELMERLNETTEHAKKQAGKKDEKGGLKGLFTKMFGGGLGAGMGFGAGKGAPALIGGIVGMLFKTVGKILNPGMWAKAAGIGLRLAGRLAIRFFGPVLWISLFAAGITGIKRGFQAGIESWKKNRQEGKGVASSALDAITTALWQGISGIGLFFIKTIFGEKAADNLSKRLTKFGETFDKMKDNFFGFVGEWWDKNKEGYKKKATTALQSFWDGLLAAMRRWVVEVLSPFVGVENAKKMGNILAPGEEKEKLRKAAEREKLRMGLNAIQRERQEIINAPNKRFGMRVDKSEKLAELDRREQELARRAMVVNNPAIAKASTSSRKAGTLAAKSESTRKRETRPVTPIVHVNPVTANNQLNQQNFNNHLMSAPLNVRNNERTMNKTVRAHY